MKAVFIVIGAVLVIGAIWYFTHKPQYSSTIIVSKTTRPTFATVLGIATPSTVNQSGIVNKPSVASQVMNQHPVMNTNIGTPIVTSPIIPSSNGMIAHSSYSNNDVYTAPGGKTMTTTAGTQKMVRCEGLYGQPLVYQNSLPCGAGYAAKDAVVIPLTSTGRQYVKGDRIGTDCYCGFNLWQPECCSGKK